VTVQALYYFNKDRIYIKGKRTNFLLIKNTIFPKCSYFNSSTHTHTRARARARTERKFRMLILDSNWVK